MSDNPRVQELLEVLLASGDAPEAVCSSCVELLPEVRERWQQVVRTRAELDAMFPSGCDSDTGTLLSPSRETSFPDIPGYKIEAVLGAGGMGVVFKARHLRLNRVVALKMALAGAYAGACERLRFQREAESIATLKHPNVVQLHDVGESHGKPYFTMEYVEGGSLAEKLAGTPLPVCEAAALVSSLAAAMYTAHSGGIVHRDLKPGNILLTADGTPKISDFGLARRLGGEAGLTRTGTALGTASYMAPEQAQCAADAVGPPADIYSLGAILYETLTGRPPFRAESGAETVHQLLTQEPVPPSRLNGKVPRDLETICLKCLSKEPRLRYVTADALSDDLNRFLRGDAISARPEGRILRAMRAVRRRPTLAVGVIAGAILAALVLAGGLWLLFDRAVIDRAVASDLNEIDDHLQKASFTEARAAIERAQGRIGSRDTPALRQQLHLRLRDCELADRLERINLDSGGVLDGMSSFAQADKEYDEAFREFGLGRYGDDPEAVAAQVRESRIRVTLLAALDRWSVVARTKQRVIWIMKVADQAEPNPTSWRKEARNPDHRWKGDALFGLIERADVKRESVALLLAMNWALGLQDPERQIPFLRKVHREHPDDLWANIYLGYALLLGKKPDEAIRYFQAVVALRPRLSIGYYSLGTVLYSLGAHAPERYDEAVVQLRKALEIEPKSGIANFTLLDTLVAARRHDEVISQAQTALRYNHKVAEVRARLGTSLKATGRVEEGFEQFRLAFSLEPDNHYVQNEYRTALLQERRWGELRPLWGKILEGNRSHHNDWYGYAELCLYLGQEEEYRRARKALLDRFGMTDSPQVAERTARACLLLPPSEEELGKAIALADLAARVDRTKAGVLYPYYQFAKGLAEYRRGHFERAIAITRGDASKMSGPLPQLLLSMALHRSGKEAAARKTLATTMLNHEWREDQANSPDGWIRHVLRREAERLILPDLPMLLDGTRKPKDNEEKSVMLGEFVFANRFRDTARLYIDIFSADPDLKRDLNAPHRYNAARYASLAGCGKDAASMPEPEREQWRRQARKLLREDLATCQAALDADQKGHRERVRLGLERWRKTPDLAGLRDANELEKLTPDERNDCLALWDEVTAILKLTESQK